jgi:hypothetical protein
MAETMQPITIQLDKERHLKLTLGGMRRFQEETKKSLLKGLNAESMTEADAIALIWACLIWEDRDLKIEDVGYMLDPGIYNEITEKIIESWGKKENSSPSPKSRSVGQNSGQ